MDWYEQLVDAEKKGRKKEIMISEEIPENVRAWPETSWLKYHVAYCILEHKYFVYPYEAFSTNCGDAGENFPAGSWRYQVSMQSEVQKHYKLKTLEESSLRYDAFYECQNAAGFLKLNEEEVCVDLYGGKPGNMGKRYWITNRMADYGTRLRGFGLGFRPLEANILYSSPGEDFILYDTGGHVMKRRGPQRLRMRDMDYDSRREGLALPNLPRWAWYKLRHRS